LINLDVNSAFYDPKTRSMRDNPSKHMKEDDQGMYKGDNAVRASGEADGVTKMEVFSWEAYKHGANVHFQAQPTQLEQMYKQHLDKKKALEEEKKDSLLDRYGGREHLEVPRGVQFAQTEHYVEYNRDGTVRKRQDRSMAKSKFEEDVYPETHSSVWGSWYDMENHKWGFACCQLVARTSICTGKSCKRVS